MPLVTSTSKIAQMPGENRLRALLRPELFKGRRDQGQREVRRRLPAIRQMTFKPKLCNTLGISLGKGLAGPVPSLPGWGRVTKT